jgi:hypothetical protein
MLAVGLVNAALNQVLGFEFGRNKYVPSARPLNAAMASSREKSARNQFNEFS